eukprot:CAMPEP_0118937208 /NCGR_PEP_ID=MMETSP1169-20130426/21977_1 /TAXON_ID=36882 /ORGANISM="Pyramimonas obovata, Strain CCMP722" /LENGTH=141 /DNA_ID=CAMNT_0006880779 /DNA_START=148 /DNA_END=573 /DNA_ORIENTATION=+
MPRNTRHTKAVPGLKPLKVATEADLHATHRTNLSMQSTSSGGSSGGYLTPKITGTRDIEYNYHAAGYNTGIVPDHAPLCQPLDLSTIETARRKWRHDTWAGTVHDGTPHPPHNANKFDHPIYRFHGFDNRNHRNETTFRLM